MRAPVAVAWITVGGLAVGAGAVRQTASTRVYGESPPVWFEAHRVAATISPDGRLAAMPIRWPESVAVIDLARGSRDAGAQWPGLDSSKAAAFTNRGELALFGWRGGEAGWYVRDGSAARKLAIPPSATPRWSTDGRRLAYFTPYARRGEPEHRFFAGAPGAERAYAVAGRVSGLAWTTAGDAVLVMLVDSTGVSTLARVSLTSGASSVVATGLDADPSTSPVAIGADGRKAFVALSSPRAASPAERNRPDADRDLDIYEIDLTSGEKRVVVGTTAEEYGPAIVGRDLYWTHTEVDMSVVTLPIAGGATTPVVRGAMLPSWRPDGRALGFCYGGLRAADWVLNWEGGAIDVDAAGRPTGTSRPVIAGYHEDFQPVWSPNGKWIAYHSHRSRGPVALYATPETTDDIYLRRAGSSAEIRLTDYGWEVGSPDWSRDGTRLVFTGWLANGGRGISYAGIITIDTVTGRPLGHHCLPIPGMHGAEMAVWSPVTDEIAIQEQVAPGKHAIWIVDQEGSGSGARKLVEYAMQTYGGVDWTGDGHTLVYSALVGERMQLFAIPAGGGVARQLTSGDANLLHPQVSPDGRRIAATRVVHRKEIRRMPYR